MPNRNFSLQSIKPGDLGLTDWNAISSLPGLDPKDRQDMLDRLTELDQLKASSDPNFGGAAAQFRTTFEGLLGQGTYVPPPVAPQPVQAAPDPVAAVPGPDSTEAKQDGSILAGIDFNAELERLLGGAPEAMSLRRDALAATQASTSAAGEFDQRAVDAATAAAEASARRHSRVIEKGAAGHGLSGSGQEGELHRGVIANLTEQVLGINYQASKDAKDRAVGGAQVYSQAAESFARALETNNAALAQALIQAKGADMQHEIDQKILDENILMGRANFTEEQRKSMKSEGWKDEEIKQAEEQMNWTRLFNERQQVADISVQQRNISLQEKVQLGSMSLEERKTSIAELRNNSDMNINEAMAQYSRQLGIDTLELERDRFYMGHDFEQEQFKALQARLEREFGLQLNEFALKDTMLTGQLNLDILNSQRKYDLESDEQREKWMASREARQLEEKLGIGKLELERILGEGELDAKREQQLLEKWMFSEGLAWEQHKFEAQLAAARKKSGGGCLKKTIGAVVGAGVGFIASGGNPLGALIGGASAVMKENGQDPSYLNQIFDYGASPSSSTDWDPNAYQRQSFDAGTLRAGPTGSGITN